MTKTPKFNLNCVAIPAMFEIEVRIYISYAANFSVLLEIQNSDGKRWIHQTQNMSLTHFRGANSKNH